jgi:hypothetical protein
VRTTTAVHDLPELAARGARDVGERPERPRRKQRIAAAPQSSGRRAPLLAERLHDGGLPRARLAADQHEAALLRLRDTIQQVIQDRQRMGSLQQCRPRRPDQ